MKLFFKYLILHFKIAMEYKSSFIFTLIAQLFFILAELLVIVSLVIKFQLFDMISIHEILYTFSLLWIGYSGMQIFGRGFDKFSNIIKNGNFDTLLTRPRSLLLQIYGTNIGYEKIGRLLIVSIIFIYSVIHLVNDWTILKLLTIFFSIVGVLIIYLSIFIINAALSFVTIQGLEIVNIFSCGSRQVGQYPMKIYHHLVRLVFTFVIPITLVNYYPLDYLCDRSSNVLLVFIPLLTFILFFISLFTFKLGLNKYTSTGS